MSLRFLLVDTSERHCSVALCAAPTETAEVQILAQRSVDEARKHADVLLSLVQAVLTECEGPTKLSAIGVVNGPGAFTGLRIGISFCQGLAYGWDIPCVPINTLELWGRSALSAHSNAKQVLVLMDARMKEVYTAGFQKASDGSIGIASGPACLAPDTLDLQWCDSDQPLMVVGSGTEPYMDQIQARVQLQGQALESLEVPSHFPAFGKLVYDQFQQGKTVLPFELDALYLRPALQ